jgi:outer membrane protein assembly factor BamB
VIVNAAIESDSIVALKKADGAEAWKYKVSGRSWSTPALVKSPEGKSEVVISVEGRVSGLDPASGKELWYCDGIKDYTCPSVTAGNGVAYVAGGRQSKILAIRTGGTGDVSDTHILWEKVMGGNVTTPALVGERVFGVSDRGVAYCLDAKTGEAAYQTRLAGGGAAGGPGEARPTPPGERPPGERPPMGRPGGGFGRPGGGRGGRGGGFGGGGGLYASVVAADGKLFAVTRTSGVYVLAAEPEYKVLAHNTFARDKSRFDATPSVAGNKLFLRSEQNLYCVQLK